MLKKPREEIKNASYPKRALNYCIDSICILLLIFIATTITGIVIIFFKMMLHIYHIASLQTTTSIFLIEAGLVALGYYIYFEVNGGKTIGKFLSSTKVVMQDGSPLTFRATLKRSIVRFMPFEEWSFVGSDHLFLHDKWSKTKVVSDQSSAFLGFKFIGIIVIAFIITFYLQKWMIEVVNPEYMNHANYLILNN